MPTIAFKTAAGNSVSFKTKHKMPARKKTATGADVQKCVKKQAKEHA